MLVFIDESGDPGLKLEQCSSRFFTITLVVFEDHNEAIACDQRIELLKKEVGWDGASEFHFKRNSDKIRRSFLQAVATYSFFYYSIVSTKTHRSCMVRDSKTMCKYGRGFENKNRRPYSLWKHGDKRHSSDQRQFHF